MRVELSRSRIDNDYAVWRAFKNNYWPAVYVVGCARAGSGYHHFGEGGLRRDRAGHPAAARPRAGATGWCPPTWWPWIRGAAGVAADWNDLKSPESYVGSEQGGELRISRRSDPARPSAYTVPGAARAQPLGPRRRVDGREGDRDRVEAEGRGSSPLPCARREPRHGPRQGRRAGALPRARRRPRAGGPLTGRTPTSRGPAPSPSRGFIS